MLSPNEVLIPVKKRTRDILRELCKKEQVSYDQIIRSMIEVYGDDEPSSPL